MFSKRIQTVLLAATATVTMTGCAGLPTAVLGKLNAQQTAVAQALINDALTSLQTDSDMNLASALAEDTTLKTQAIELEAAATVEASGSVGARERQRSERFKDRAKHRLEKAKGAIRTVEKVETPNADGGKTVKITMSVNHKNGVQLRVVERVYAADASLLAATAHFEHEHKNGVKMVGDRNRALAADGTWHSTFKAVLTRKDGKVKTTEWTRVEAADGSETGEGKITRFDGSVVTISISKSADGTVVTKTVDSRAQLNAEITQGDVATDASVVVTDAASGQAAATTTVSNTEEVEPSEQ